MAFVNAGTCCPSFWGRGGKKTGAMTREGGRSKRRVHSPRGPTYLKGLGGGGSYHGSRRRGGGRAEMTYSVPIGYGPRDARSNVGFTAGVGFG